MSIISDALKKAADKRRGVTRLREEDFTRDLDGHIEKIASKKTRWSLLSSLGTFFIVGFAIIAFLYNVEFLPSFMNSAGKTSSTVVPKKLDLERTISPADVDKPKVITKPRPKKTGSLLFNLRLNGIMEGKGESLAVINNKILRKGDFIEGAELIDISSNKVTLLYNRKEIILYME